MLFSRSLWFYMTWRLLTLIHASLPLWRVDLTAKVFPNQEPHRHLLNIINRDFSILIGIDHLKIRVQIVFTRSKLLVYVSVSVLHHVFGLLLLNSPWLILIIDIENPIRHSQGSFLAAKALRQQTLFTLSHIWKSKERKIKEKI